MKYSILIIDDSLEDRYLLKRQLKKCGLETIIAEASNGEEAMDFLLRFDEQYKDDYPEMMPPVIAFLDINMPIMNGWEFLDAFRERLDEIQISPTIVVMYSTSDQEQEVARTRTYGFVKSYVVKGSYTPQQLRDTILTCAGH